MDLAGVGVIVVGENQYLVGAVGSDELMTRQNGKPERRVGENFRE